MLCVPETVQPYSLAQMKLYSVAVTAGVSSTEMFPTHRLQTAVECNEGLDSIPTGFQISTFDLHLKRKLLVKASIDEEASTAEVIACRPGAVAAPLWPAVGFSNLQMLQVKGLKWCEHDMNPCELMMGEVVGNCWFNYIWLYIRIYIYTYIHWIELGSLVVYDSSICWILYLVTCKLSHITSE